MNKFTQSITKQWQYIVIGLLAVALIGTTVWALRSEDEEVYERGQRFGTSARQQNGRGQDLRAADDVTAHLEEHGITPLTNAEASNKQATADELAYLIEEEKLAHDVYQAMYTKWGARVFGNIQRSETMHQNMVWAVMNSRGLSDPRTQEVGRFNNTDLQALYDRLIAQGNQSRVDAYKVGVIVEETDIADLKKTIANLDTADTDVKATLENLLHASENHLRAFNRQLGR